MARYKRRGPFGVVCLALKWWLIATLVYLALPFAGALFDCGSERDQRWLDAAITHLKLMQAECGDSDLQAVLDYTIQRYNKIGRFNVAVQWTVSINPNCRAMAYNAPWCPGLTLDHDLVESYPIKFGAVILCHEALHDWFPYFGHDHIRDRERKLHDLSEKVHRNRIQRLLEARRAATH